MDEIWDLIESVSEGFLTYSCSVKNLFYSQTRSHGYKTFFVLNSIEHEILNAHKYKNINKFGFFQDHISLECYFSRS